MREWKRLGEKGSEGIFEGFIGDMYSDTNRLGGLEGEDGLKIIHFGRERRELFHEKDNSR